MPDLYGVYVPAPNRPNLDQGLESLQWGWKDSALATADYRAVANDIEPGDVLVLATDGPRRAPRHGWNDAQVGYAVITEVTRGLYRSTHQLWRDDPYPNRLDFAIASELRDAGASELSHYVMEALRESSTRQGTPFRAGSLSILPLGALAPTPTPGNEVALEGENGEPEERGDGLLAGDGPLDLVAEVIRRAEQRRLRRAKFGAAQSLTCDLCGRTWPRRFVRAAHIKRRAECSATEKRSLDNIMAACVMGCDELFEHGYISIRDGHVISRPGIDGDLAAAARTLVGSAVRNWSRAAESFAREHRMSHRLE